MNDELKARVAMLEEHIDKLNEQSAVLYEQGWNAGLELAACKMIADLRKAFPPDTLASFAAYLKAFKK